MNINEFLGSLVDRLPTSDLLYRFCRRYLNRCDGLNNGDMQSNGELHWLREILPACSIVFDVGANVGDWTRCALKINCELQIHCFEPSEATFRLLQVPKIQGRVFLNQMGLGAKRAEASLHVSAQGAGSNSIHERTALGVGQTHIERISLDTLDAYCARCKITYIDLLKLDVEGHELEVLKGAVGMLGVGGIRRIQFEYGGTYIDSRILLKDMFDFLAPFGFEFYKVHPKSLRYIERYDQHLENFHYQNFVALKAP